MTSNRPDILDRVTPAGVLLGSPAPGSEEWFALRRGGITATDLPKILGLSKYGNARSVWHDKRGELDPDPGGEAAHWGHLLEDVVTREWSHRRDADAFRVGLIANATDPWMRVALDRVVVWCPDADDIETRAVPNVEGESPMPACALEVKTRSAFTAGRWRDDVPDDVLAQVAWQRLTTGLDHIHIACLLGGQRLVEHRYDADTDLEQYLLAAGWSVWRDVQNGTPPAVDMDGVLADLLDQLFPDRAGEREVDAATAERLLAAYCSAKDAEATAERMKDAARASVISEMGEHEVLTHGGTPVFTYRPQTKQSINVADLEANDVELFEQVLSGGHITETTSRVLRVAKRSADDGQ